MKILFQNDFFVAVDKPSGWLTTPARFGDKDPRPVLGLELQKELKLQIFPVHRLDFEVSGLVLYALNAKAHSQANTLFESKQVQKTYQALTENKNPTAPDTGREFEWKSRILRGKKRAFESPHGKPSLTRATCLGTRGLGGFGAGLGWELRPLTGRSHQLRFDLFRHGFSIKGDVLYGAQDPVRHQNEIALRSIRIQFQDQTFCQRWKLPDAFRTSDLFIDEIADQLVEKPAR
jgi:tRNA pseudouridine32 synthase / 23S rRNA pseudouridine746 synthase